MDQECQPVSDGMLAVAIAVFNNAFPAIRSEGATCQRKHGVKRDGKTSLEALVDQAIISVSANQRGRC